MFPRFRVPVYAVSLGLAAGAAITSAPISAQATGPIHGIPDRQPVTASTVLTGKLARNGAAVANGDIQAIAWPKASVLEAAADNDAVISTQVVYKGKTDSLGTFAVTLDPTKLPAAYVANSGQVDIEIVVADATSQANWFTSVMRAEQAPAGNVTAASAGAATRAGWTTESAIANGSLDTQDVVFDLGAATADASDDPVSDQAGPNPGTLRSRDVLDAPVTGRTFASAQTVSAMDDGDPVAPKLNVEPRNAKLLNQPLSTYVSDSTIRPADVCSTISAGRVRNRREYFAGVYAWGGALATMDFNAGSHHELGVAIKSGSGNWTAGGTSGIETSAGATVTGLHDIFPVNKVNYGIYKNICWTYTMYKPISFYAILPNGEFIYTTHKSFTASCSAFANNAAPWKNKTKNVTYSTGVDLPSINVSARSGWSQSTKEQFVVTRNTWICGNNKDGWLQSSQVDARQR